MIALEFQTPQVGTLQAYGVGNMLDFGPVQPDQIQRMGSIQIRKSGQFSSFRNDQFLKPRQMNKGVGFNVSDGVIFEFYLLE